MRFVPMLLVLLVLSPLMVCAQQGERPDWSPFAYLLGEWVAEGGGTPGEGVGTFSLTQDLQQSVLIRKSHVDYPAVAGRPAFAHDDLMIIYPEDRGAFQAHYFDNEGHVIHYRIRFSSPADSVIMVSDAVPGAPGFRFTYVKCADETLKSIFEIAPPGKPGTFAKYVEGVAHRRR